jgi:hypothetical protein
MASRRKSLAPRHPGGKLVQSEPDISPGEVRRLRDAALRGLRDAEWASELGRYYLEGKLNHAQFAAGKWWTMLAARYADAIGAKPHPKPIALERGSASHQCDPGSERGLEIAQTHERDVRRFLAAYEALQKCGTIAVKAVRDLCEYDQSPGGHHDFTRLIEGLNVLAREHEALTNQRKRISDR